MTRMIYAGFLRAVNVAGNQLSMAALKEVFGALGFDNPKTLLQSGNIVFGADPARNAIALEELLQRETEKRLHVKTEYFVRTAKDLERVISGNPFIAEAQNDPGRLVVVFLKDAPAGKAVAQLQAAIRGPERVKASGRHLHVTYPEGQGRSKLTNAVIEKALGTRGTARNWNTVLKVAAALTA
jgi:uncharacterized protein (DUF1697 family)